MQNLPLESGSSSRPPIASEKDLAAAIAEALREDFGDEASAVKHIGMITNANLNTIANWYQGKHAPSSRHLLHLARNSVGILRTVLLAVGAEELWDAFQIFQNRARTTTRLPRSAPLQSTTNLSVRKLWFLSALNEGAVNAESLATEFSISVRTARRDISELAAEGAIRFVGAKKNGHYLLNQPAAGNRKVSTTP